MFQEAKSRVKQIVSWTGEHRRRAQEAIFPKFASRHPEVRMELLRLLYGYAPAVLAANVVNGALVLFIFWSVVAQYLLVVWYVLLLATVVARARLWSRYRCEPPSAERADRWGRLATIGSGLSGILWGSAGVLFFVPDSPIHHTVLAFVLGGMGAGAVPSLTAHLPAFHAYLVLSVLPFAARLLAVGDAERLAMASMALLYLVALLLVGWRAHMSLAQSIALRLSNVDLSRIASIVESSFDAIISMTLERRITSWNAAAERMYGYAAHEVIGEPIELIVPPERLTEFRTIYEQLGRGERVEPFETERMTKDGRRLEIALSLSPIKDQLGAVAGFSAIGRDITERRRAEDRIRHLALHDSLTGLPNRALFQDRLRQALAEARRHHRRAALLLLDLDHFKDINDVLGHAAGDRFLAEIARRLDACVRESDTVARLGGDEFALILTELQFPEDAALVARKAVRTVAECFRLEDQDVQTTASVGITIYPADTEDADRLLRDADLALYRAKAEGRNTYRFYAAAMGAQVEARRALERDLRMAIERRELELYFQPQLDLAAGCIDGAEALARWRHPRRGTVPPSKFIPLAETSGLIVPLGEWALREACRQARAWRDAGLPPLTVAVNLSLAQCRNDDLARTTGRALQASGLEPRWLELEVTESLFLHPNDDQFNRLQRLRKQGVRVSIDDFGTGYSSLGRLRGLPVDKIKIDGSFVAGVGNDPDSEAIVRAVISLGRSLGLRVLAEGVETGAQYEFLRAEGCDAAQGFHIAQPLPAPDFAALYGSGRAFLH
jgi:diguanylate cyclase (GGDEF)-like protein/PAS domain S-box-containing protein